MRAPATLTDAQSHSLTTTTAEELETARRRTLSLLEPVPEPLLERQHSDLLSPMVWDLAHIANFEDLWLLRRLGDEGVGDSHDGTYDSFLHPRMTRGGLDMLDLAGARSYAERVRDRVLDLLQREGSDGDEPLRSGGYVYKMVVQHEHQHDETILAALNLLPEGYAGLQGTAEPQGSGDAAVPAPDCLVRECLVRECIVPAGTYVVGTSSDPWSYDNEGPAHEVELAPYAIDTLAVTNAAWVEFMAGGGYREPSVWTEKGWAWRQEAGLERPLTWEGDGSGGWVRKRFGLTEPVPPEEPVQHVCWYEADAFARWAGRRLPTEEEWEVAATCDPRTGEKWAHPWGDQPWRPGLANLGQVRMGPGPVGANPQGRSSVGCFAMLGDVWEWTSSSFEPWPGTTAFPYREYSEVFYGGDHRVLRGGSWATHPTAARGTFRNWDHPVRRHIFAGLRTARSL
ncbi:MAG: ergothioneine biosynthesis protein EgtB [Acidimicrobiales bacterium]